MGENCKALLQKFQLKKIFSEWKTDFSELEIPFLEKHSKTILFLIVLAGFLARLGYHFLEPDLNKDSITYIDIVNIWNQYGDYSMVLQKLPEFSWMPPLFCGIIRLLTLTGLSAETAGFTLVILSGTLVVPIVYMICKCFSSRSSIALSAAFLAAFHPILIETSIAYLRDSLYVAISAWILYFLVKYIFSSFRRIWIAPAAAVIALGVNVRFEALEFFCLFGIIWGLAFFLKYITWKEIFISAILFSVIFLSMFFLIHVLLGTTFFYRIFYERVFLYLDRFRNFIPLLFGGEPL